MSSWVYPLAAVCLSSVGAAVVVNCGTSESSEENLSDDDMLGVNNALGLGVLFEQAPEGELAGRVLTTLQPRNPSYALRPTDKLYVRLRQGKITLTSQKDLNCAELANGGVTISASDVASRTASGKVVYKNGPKLTQNLVDLLHFNELDPTDDANQTPERAALVANGIDPIIEACVVNAAGKPRAKLVTNLAFAWDEGSFELGTYSPVESARTLAGPDGGVANNTDSGTAIGVAARPVRLREGTKLTSQIAYAQLCEQELGENPFFPKRAGGGYDTFDCRDGLIAKGDGTKVKGVGIEGAMIPVTRNGVPVTNCDPGQELSSRDYVYDCVNDTEQGMMLHRVTQGGVQPGAMVHSAKNSKGTHWVLLCRAVGDDGNGMTKTKTFSDIAMIGNNPANGKTCFFQNSIAQVGRGRGGGPAADGAAVVNPADVDKSPAMWAGQQPTYCTECHSKSAFVHSRWIDGAVRANGKSVVPKMGELNDYLISKNDAPFYVVNQDAQGFVIPKQLVSEEVGPCANCHRVPVARDWMEFSQFSVGGLATPKAKAYMAERSSTGKSFAYAHWMPTRLDGVDESTWATSKFGIAVDHIKRCTDTPSAPECITAPVPRGSNRPAR